jgi:hypothetical protein
VLEIQVTFKSRFVESDGIIRSSKNMGFVFGKFARNIICQLVVVVMVVVVGVGGGEVVAMNIN